MEGKMNQRLNASFICLAVFAAMLAPVFACARSAALQAEQSHKKEQKSPAVGQYQEEGQRVFRQQCSRCHAVPDGFSPRISGTVVRHMRVRASLSEHDEQLLLKFFNP
jgi:cytochrome c5